MPNVIDIYLNMYIWIHSDTLKCFVCKLRKHLDNFRERAIHNSESDDKPDEPDDKQEEKQEEIAMAGGINANISIQYSI